MTLGVDVLYVWIPCALGSRDVGVSWEESACGSMHTSKQSVWFLPVEMDGRVSWGSRDYIYTSLNRRTFGISLKVLDAVGFFKQDKT